MTSIAQAAIAASVLVGLVSIPAASQSATSQEVVSNDLPDISSENNPREVVRETSSDGFRAEVETAFNRFRTEVSSESMKASVENPNSDLQVRKTPSETRWKLQTSSGTLEVVESGNRVVEKSSTPEGSLKVTRENGTRKIEFQGSDRDEVERQHHELRNMMESRKKDLDDRRQEMRERSQPDLEVIANRSTASGYGDNDREHVVLVNNDLNSINLRDWELTDNVDSYTFPPVTLEAGESVKVYSSKEWRGNEGTELSWNDDGDTATVYDDQGREIDSRSY